jgi:hypothetical protein
MLRMFRKLAEVCRGLGKFMCGLEYTIGAVDRPGTLWTEVEFFSV